MSPNRKKRYSRLAIIRCADPIAIVARFQLRPEKKIDSLLPPEKKVPIVITTGKKSSSCLSGGCAIAITTRKKIKKVVCLAGARSLLRLEKKKF